MTIPFRKPYILPVYVKNILAMVDALGIAGDMGRTLGADRPTPALYDAPVAYATTHE